MSGTFPAPYQNNPAFGPPANAVSSYQPGYTAGSYTAADGSIVTYYAPPPVGAGQFQNSVQGAPVSGGSGASSTAGGSATGTSSTLQTWSGYISELFKRIGVGALGVMLILLALFFMFADAAIHEYQSK